MNVDLHDSRRDYSGGVLPERVEDPWAFFAEWFEQARAEQTAGRLEEATAMVVSTADAQGRPSARVLLAKAFGADLGPEGGVDFYTSGDSRKGQELQANPQASILFFWPSLNRQVRFEGRVEVKPVAEAEAYFSARPFESRVAAVVSRQSAPRSSRQELEAEFAAARERFADGTVPRPEDWLGWRLVPDRIEFWQGLPGRLHDRILCTRGAQGWSSGRLDP